MAYQIIYNIIGDEQRCRLIRSPGDIQDKLPVTLLHGARDQITRPRSRRHRRLDYYSLSWFKEGDCTHWDEYNGTRKLSSGCAILTCPDVLHLYGSQHDFYREDCVSFTGPAADSLVALGVIDPKRPLIRLKHPESLAGIVSLTQTFSVASQLQASTAIQSLLIDSWDDQQRSPSSPRATIDQLLTHIAEHPEIHLSNADMATFCHMSEPHFRRVFKEMVGISPITHCEQMRMRMACQMLVSTSQRISEIAQRLGYADPLYFTKRFRKVIGTTPRSYRASTA